MIASYNLNADFNPKPSNFDLETRLRLCLSIGEECVEEKELKKCLEKKEMPVCYDGFEPSGRMHIAQGVMKCVNVNKMVDAGCICIFWIADWFAVMNKKMGGDLEKIRTVGKYFIHVWKAMGMKLQNVKFLWASEEISKNSSDYLMKLFDVSGQNTISRMKKCATIMGKDENDDLLASQMIYSCMQCTDVFFLEADICQMGMDQRKVNMIAREYSEKKKQTKPIMIAHHMLSGLKEGQLKMSKSSADSAIFMEDSEKDVENKIAKAFCPEGDLQNNPCLEYVKYIVLDYSGEFLVERSAQFGDNKMYKNFTEVQEDFKNKNLHPKDLKKALSKAINKIIQPVRDHFINDGEAKKLLEIIKNYKS